MSGSFKRILNILSALTLAALACQAVSPGGDAPIPALDQPEELPTAAEAPSPDVLFEDDFDDPDSGWLRLRDDEGITDYEQGGYRIKVDKTDWFFWVEAGRTFTNVQIDIDATKLAGPDQNEFGVICRYVDEQNFYFLSITSDGFYGITKLINDEYEFIGMSEMQSSSAINQGAASNHLQAVCDGNSLRLSVNGSLVADVRDDLLSSGDVGLIAGTTDTPGADILFDNMLVTSP
jgi:hypothetical protein